LTKRTYGLKLRFTGQLLNYATGLQKVDYEIFIKMKMKDDAYLYK